MKKFVKVMALMMIVVMSLAESAKKQRKISTTPLKTANPKRLRILKSNLAIPQSMQQRHLRAL